MLAIITKLKTLVLPSVLTQAANFIIKEEGFSPTPYPDHKQWSWGYGTAAGFDMSRKPAGTITQAQAKKDLEAYLKNSYKTILNALRVQVKTNQMVALLSFDYNLGFGNTQNIIGRINAGFPTSEVAAAMNLYINAGGKRNEVLVARRKRESNLFLA